MLKSAHPWRLNLLLLVVSTLAGIILVESFLRLTNMDYPVVWQPDAKLGWRSIPGATRIWTEEGHAFIKINKLGHRDRERQLGKEPGTFRIAVFGDSMTQAVQVNLEQTFCYLLEQRLRARKLPVEVLNFGVNGYSPIQELLLFSEEGQRYSPDLVILAVFLDNDVSGVHPDLGVVNQAGPPFVSVDNDDLLFDYSRPRESFDHYHREPFYSLRRYSALYRLFSDYRWRRAAAAPTQATIASYVPQRYLLYQRPLAKTWEQAWRVFDRVILEFAAEARREQIPLVLLSVPAAQIVSKNAWRNIITSFPSMNSLVWDLEGPELRFAAFAKEHGLALMQPYKAYEERGANPPLFFGNVGHLTAAGHQIMAQALEEFLLSERLTSNLFQKYRSSTRNPSVPKKEQ
jgi:lysophospholipase L1-like esterase